ncbi:hypothetical protein CLIB1444_12S03752 [[Candida] jaroonii]|uniref:Uncharacterized protein n=1 Tax=[Candida] jaroonii TaxID=467808 RepID=A0ACA9YEJ2_9ASCO|nr:hypothetical protein CLIB1444_12S03752 [[Candida] jaroonii]
MDSEQLKNLGNVAFSHKNYDDAITLYTKALLQDDTNPILFSNRAMCQIKLSNWDRALQDCDSGLALECDDKTKVKLLFRKATTFKGMKSMKLALQYFQKVVDLDSSNEAALKEIKSLNIEEPHNKRIPIPIEKVDKLPEEYEALLNDRPPPVPSVTQEIENPGRVSKEIDELFGDKPKPQPKPTFVERPTTSPLMALKSIPGANRDKAYTYVINLPVSSLVDDFSFGMEPDFLSFYVEAAAHVSSNNSVNGWDTLILNNFQQLSKVKRFDISKTFIKQEDLNTLLANVSSTNPDLLPHYETIFQ